MNILKQYLYNLYLEHHASSISESGGSPEYRAREAADIVEGMAEDDLDNLLPKWWEIDTLDRLTKAIESNDMLYDRLNTYMEYR